MPEDHKAIFLSFIRRVFLNNIPDGIQEVVMEAAEERLDEYEQELKIHIHQYVSRNYLTTYSQKYQSEFFLKKIEGILE